MSAKELKAACKEKGLLVTGNKRTLIDRLENPDAPSAKRSRAGRMGVPQVHSALAALGYPTPRNASACVKKAIQNGHLSLEGGLDKTAFSADCENCGKAASCTLRALLGQADSPGLDYEDGGEGGAIICEGEKCPRKYVIGYCNDEPRAESGKFFNHCKKCPGFGKCTEDPACMCISVHCDNCGRHYNAGRIRTGRADCPKCGFGGPGFGF